MLSAARTVVALTLVIPTGTPVAATSTTSAMAWSHARQPSRGPSQAIGGYSAGCLDGAVELPLSGAGYRVIHPERHRRFGHPLLVDVIRELGRRIDDAHLGWLPVGDLSQARGGPAPTGHASHQTGLDVDLWYAPPDGGSAVSMVDAAHERPSPRFTSREARLVELAATDARVDRVFVNPILKRAMCEHPGKSSEWLHKVRPWWGHDDHFHVRLACPPDSPDCVAQSPLPAGDGCDELAWWFSAATKDEREKDRQAYGSKVGATPQLPTRCSELASP